MDIQIRLAKSEELKEILELQAKSLRTASAEYNPIQIESLVRSQASARVKYDEIWFVADYEDKVVGFASLLLGEPTISGVFVHPDFMRQGIGTRLLEAIEKTAVDKKYEILYVVSSLTAVNFYQTRGYQFIRKSGFSSEANVWIPCVSLEKRLLLLTKTEDGSQRSNYLIPSLKQISASVLGLIIIALIAAFLPLIISLIVSLFR
ncbi:hypothetical protein NIES4074_12260 [Cylindrospermum sp. NIES-4074]|nr:hypothetical protein NIES4074_12260 [Cylindrospermum sp. NIES-4074]